MVSMYRSDITALVENHITPHMQWPYFDVTCFDEMASRAIF